MAKAKRKQAWKPATAEKQRQTRHRKLPGSVQHAKEIDKRRSELPMGLHRYRTPSANHKSSYMPTEADRIFVRKLVSYGMTHEQTCNLIEARYSVVMSPTELRKHFSLELKTGLELYTMSVADRLNKKIRQDNLTAIIFYLKTKGRWSTQVNVGDPNGNVLKPPTVNVVFGPEESDEELPPPLV